MVEETVKWASIFLETLLNPILLLVGLSLVALFFHTLDKIEEKKRKLQELQEFVDYTPRPPRRHEPRRKERKYLRKMHTRGVR